jgi:hypothetical protein
MVSNEPILPKPFFYSVMDPFRLSSFVVQLSRHSLICLLPVSESAICAIVNESETTLAVEQVNRYIEIVVKSVNFKLAGARVRE